MGTLAKVLGFSLSLTLAFTLIANLLPQVEGEAPKEEKLDLGAMSIDDFAALGETIFSGKGTCTLCHNNMGRAPDLLAFDVVGASVERLADSRYQGEAKDAEAYIRESMINPGIYVVKGFGKKGSNDSESPMPAVNQAPIELSDAEVTAVIAFLQSKDGNEITVSVPSDAPAPVTEAAAAPALAQTPEEIIKKYTCNACHSVLGTESPVGPDLRTVGSRLSAAEISQSILEPAAVIAEGFPPIMPPNVADKMAVSELKMLVAYLADQKGS